jgi:hypothetical protein
MMFSPGLDFGHICLRKSLTWLLTAVTFRTTENRPQFAIRIFTFPWLIKVLQEPDQGPVRAIIMPLIILGNAEFARSFSQDYIRVQGFD